MNLTFQSEGWATVVEEFRKLWLVQWEEIALDHADIPYDPDWSRYADLDNLGYLKITTVRDDKQLVGWHICTVSPHPHYKSTLFAMQDMYYVLSNYRRMPTIGMRLFMAMEESMRILGVREMVGNTKLHLDRSVLFERLGWKKTAVCYRKVLT